MRSYRDEFAVFEQAGAVVLGISPQNVDSHERFADAEGFTFPLLSDTDLRVGSAYGIVAWRLYRRAVFIVGVDGKVTWKNVKLMGATWDTAQDLERALGGL